MPIRHILAVSLVALLLSASSAGAACELSCNLAQSQSDCHSRFAQDARSDDSSGKMDTMDMGMAGMSMPDVNSTDGEGAVSPVPEPGAGHPSIGEMGPCERQSCDNRPVASVRRSRSNAPQFHSFLFATDLPGVSGMALVVHDARDDATPRRPRDASPLNVSLRV